MKSDLGIAVLFGLVCVGIVAIQRKEAFTLYATNEHTSPLQDYRWFVTQPKQFLKEISPSENACLAPASELTVEQRIKVILNEDDKSFHSEFKKKQWNAGPLKTVQTDILTQVISMLANRSGLKDLEYDVVTSRVATANKSKSGSYVLGLQVVFHKTPDIYASVVTFDALYQDEKIFFANGSVVSVLHEQFFAPFAPDGFEELRFTQARNA